MERPGFIRMGKITKAHGLKGAVKVHLYGESPELFREKMEILIVRPDGTEGFFTLRWVNTVSRPLLFNFSNVENRNQAENLVGSEILVDKSCLPELEEGAYYWSDIIGLDVYDTNHAYLGSVTSIIPTPGNDVYVVRDNETETLIPALDWVVLSIDLDDRVMHIDLPEGYEALISV